MFACDVRVSGPLPLTAPQASPPARVTDRFPYDCRPLVISAHLSGDSVRHVALAGTLSSLAPICLHFDLPSTILLALRAP